MKANLSLETDEVVEFDLDSSLPPSLAKTVKATVWVLHDGMERQTIPLVAIQTRRGRLVVAYRGRTETGLCLLSRCDTGVVPQSVFFRPADLVRPVLSKRGLPARLLDCVP